MEKKDIPTAIEKDIKQTENMQMLNQDSSNELQKSISILQNPTRIETTTILTNKQVNGLVMMNWAGQVYGISFFKEYASRFPFYRISGDDGRGRKEAIKIAEAIQLNKHDEQLRLAELFKR